MQWLGILRLQEVSDAAWSWDSPCMMSCCSLFSVVPNLDSNSSTSVCLLDIVSAGHGFLKNSERCCAMKVAVLWVCALLAQKISTELESLTGSITRGRRRSLSLAMLSGNSLSCLNGPGGSSHRSCKSTKVFSRPFKVCYSDLGQRSRNIALRYLQAKQKFPFSLN